MAHDWELVIERGETRNVDFKGPLAWDGDAKVELAKDIAAFANTRDGGQLVIGVEKTSHSVVGLTPDQLLSFDPTKIANYVNERFQPDVSVRVVKPVVRERPLTVIEVAEFEETPVICVQQGMNQEKGKTTFKPGSVFIRTSAAATELVGPDEMRELLGLQRSPELTRPCSRELTHALNARTLGE